MQGASGVEGSPTSLQSIHSFTSILHLGRVKLLAHFLYLLQKCAAFSALAHHSFHFLLTTASPPSPPHARMSRPCSAQGRRGRKEGGGGGRSQADNTPQMVEQGCERVSAQG